MSTTQIKGNQIQDGTITSADVDDSLEKDFTKVSVSTGDSSPDFLSSKVLAGDNITINVVGVSGSVQYLAISGSIAGGGGSGTITGVTAGTGLTGGGASGNVTLSLSATGSQGTYGSTSQIPLFAVNDRGVVTSVTNTSVQITESQVTDLVTDLSNKASTSTAFSAGAGLTGGGDLSTNRSFAINDSIVATVSGTTFTGTTKHNAGLSGSLTKLTDGTSYLIAGSGMTISTGSTGAVTIARVGSIDGDITGVTAGTGLTGGGTSGTVSLAINNAVVATVSGAQFTGPISSTGFTLADRVLITSGSSRTISQSNMFWDSTNNYLGLGMATPARNLNVNSGFRLGGSSGYIEWVGVNSSITRITVGGTQNTLEMNQDTLFPPNKTIGFQSALAAAKDSGFSRAAAGIINVSGSAPGAIFRFNAVSTPLAAGDLGMNTATGRPNALIGGSVRELAHTAEIAPLTSNYIVTSADATLTNERVLTAGSGITITDGGAGSTITISATGVGSGGGADVAASYVVLSATGSLPNDRVLTAGSGITITDGGSGGNVTIAATGGGAGGSSYFTSTTPDAIFTTGSVAFKGSELIDSPANKGTDVYFYVSGSTTQKSLFGGDVRISGSLTVGTGSITLTSNDIQFGSSANKIELSGTSLKFYDSSNASGRTLTSLLPGLIHIESKYINSNTQTVTFSNLDGNTDKFYYLMGKRINGGNSSVSYEIRPNGTTSNLYSFYHNVTRATDASITHAVGSYNSTISWGTGMSSGSHGNIEMFFDGAVEGGRPRHFNIRSVFQGSTTFLLYNLEITGRWTDSSTNLTSLDIYSSVASGFIAGSEFHLYKLRRG